MGDRTWCVLRIGGLLPEADAETLFELIDDAGASQELMPPPSPPSRAGSKIKRILVDGIEFEEVNHAQLDDRLQSFLKVKGLSYVWEWDSGGGYGSGIELFDGHSGETAAFCHMDGEIMLTLKEAQNPEILAKAAAWHSFRRKINGVKLYSGHHELLEAKREMSEAADTEGQG